MGVKRSLYKPDRKKLRRDGWRPDGQVTELDISRKEAEVAIFVAAWEDGITAVHIHGYDPMRDEFSVQGVRRADQSVVDFALPGSAVVAIVHKARELGGVPILTSRRDDHPSQDPASKIIT